MNLLFVASIGVILARIPSFGYFIMKVKLGQCGATEWMDNSHPLIWVARCILYRLEAARY